MKKRYLITCRHRIVDLATFVRSGLVSWHSILRMGSGEASGLTMTSASTTGLRAEVTGIVCRYFSGGSFHPFY